MLLTNAGSHRQRTLEILGQAGVESHRVEFVAPRPRKSYLELYHRLDVALDAFPYNGHATSLDALWMGVPVVSLAGERAVGRFAINGRASLCPRHRSRLPDYVAAVVCHDLAGSTHGDRFTHCG
jgi:hypothetical protein